MATTGFQVNGSDVSNYFVPRDVFSSGQLWVWGGNNLYQLGTNDSQLYSSPVQTVAAGINWKQISGGDYYTAAIKTDGTLWLWGNNDDGGLGTNNTTTYSSPVQTVSGGTNWKQVGCGYSHTAAIKTDGTLWMWGNNVRGQLGTNDTTYRSSPVQTVAGGTNWKIVACGDSHTAAIKTDGTLWMWGWNNWGQLGDNIGTNRSSPIQTIAAGTNWKQVDGGLYHTTAIKTDGTLWMWGNNDYGQLGDNTVNYRLSPVQTIAGGNNWKQVTSGAYYIRAIKTDGTLWTWGYNDYGQLGTNNITKYSSPVQTVAGGTNWKQVKGGKYHTTAIKTDGTLWMWGYNSNGQLGDNTITYKSSPIQTVAGGNNWKQVTGGSNHTVAINDIS